MNAKKLMRLILCGITLNGAARPSRAPDAAMDRALGVAIRQGDMTAMRRALEAGADPNALDEGRVPALMNAVLHAGEPAVRLLLDHGANVNATDRGGATAVLWGAGDVAKANLLLSRGADPKAASAMGRTPLHVAAGTAGASAVVARLLKLGSPVDARDQLKGIPVLFTGGGGGTPLIDAGRAGDVASVRLLLDHGADVNASDSVGGTALSEAVLYGHTEVVRLLLARGASVKATPGPLAAYSILALAAMRGSLVTARMLIAAGADVNAADKQGRTPLMWAVSGDRENMAMVELLIKHGADPGARSKTGETALTRARLRGRGAAAAHLEKYEPAAPAMERPAPSAATARAAAVGHEAVIGMLAASGALSFKNTGCATCHHDTLPLMVMAKARDRNIAVQPKDVEQTVRRIGAMFKPATDVLLQGSDVMPDIPVTGGYVLWALHQNGSEPDAMTTAMVHQIARRQTADGRWIGWTPRPPLEHGDIQATAMAVAALRFFTPPGRMDEMESRMRRAQWYLLNTVPETTEDHTMRLWGLMWTQAPARSIASAARSLAKLQREDGGWAQLPGLEADAYATGKALMALMESGVAEEPVIQRGIAYLRRTRFEDGTWMVVTRAVPLQPLADTGFPHGRNQWISTAATSWALMALMEAEHRPAPVDGGEKPSRGSTHASRWKGERPPLARSLR